MPRWIANLLVALLVLGIPPFLILTNAFICMTPNWLDFQYSRPGFPKSVRFSDADRRYNAAESIEYIRGNRTFDQLKALGVYDERESKHMVDVRELVDKVKVVLPVDGILLFAVLVALAWQPATRALAARGLLGGAVLTVAFFGAVGIFAATGFNTFFTLFHHVFFEGDTWLFNYTDSLIQFYPLPFWFATSIALVLTTVVEAAIIGAIGWWWGRRVASQQ